jgi:hypothetical protein
MAVRFLHYQLAFAPDTALTLLSLRAETHAAAKEKP